MKKINIYDTIVSNGIKLVLTGRHALKAPKAQFSLIIKKREARLRWLSIRGLWAKYPLRAKQVAP